MQRWLVVGVVGLVAAAATVVVSAPSGADEEPLVRAAVQVTANPDPIRAHSSPQIAVNPVNDELVIVESNPRATSDHRQCHIHISSDDGRSWVPGGELMLEPYTDCSLHGEYGPYATLAFSDDGTLFVAFVANDPKFADPSTFSSGLSLRGGFFAHPPRRTPRNVFLARSMDGGRSFETTAVFIGAEEPARAPATLPPDGENKGPMVAADPEDPSRVYVGWRQGDLTDDSRKLRTMIAASHDGGQTFEDPVDVSDERGGDFPALAVGPDHVVHAVYWTRGFSTNPSADGEPAPVRPINYVQSTDGGATWSEPVPADPGNQDAERPPSLVADPASGNLYMVWYANADPNNDAEGFDGDLDVFLRTSTDGGSTWGERVVVNDDDGGIDQFEPGVSVAPDGRVDVAWYDFRNSPTTKDDAGFSDVYYAFSTDAGQSFGPNTRITDRAIDRSIGVWSNNISSKFNVGVASTTNTAYFAWQDSRNGDVDSSSEDVYMASAQLAPGSSVGTAGRAPAWLLVGAGLAVGMGLAMLLAALLARRTRA